MLANVVFEPGFFSSHPVQVAALAGGIVALVSGVVGVYTVIRGQSFAGHAFSDMSTTGGAAAFLLGVAPVWGFLGIGVVAAGGMELLGLQRERGRDVATGIVLGAALGVSALLLYWDTTTGSTTGATITILFGSLFTISGATVPAMLAFALVVFVITLLLYRPLLLASVSPDMAAADGVPVRLVSLAFLLMMAIAVSMSSVAVGAILSTSLLIGPAATAVRLTSRPGAAMATAALIGLVATWLGVWLAYDSYYWPPVRHGWPVSFFVVAWIFVFYLGVDIWCGRRDRSKGAACSPA